MKHSDVMLANHSQYLTHDKLYCICFQRKLLQKVVQYLQKKVVFKQHTVE